MKKPTATKVVVDPSVISRFFLFQAKYPHNEVAALLLGRLDESTLYVENLVPASKLGTSVSVDFSPADFERAMDGRKNGQTTVGGVHGHPSYGPFLSSVDQRHQTQGQELFPDFVSLVMDPFRDDGVQFRFFRVKDGKAVTVPHEYGRFKCSTRGKPSSTAGTKKQSGIFARLWRALVPWARKSPSP